MAWGAVGGVVVLVVVFVLVRITSPSPTNLAGTTDPGRHPQLASAAYVDAMTSIPAAVYNRVGTDGQPEPFTLTRGQPPLAARGLPRLVYEGAEFCPYCAMMRYSLVAALSRFGTFADLKETESGGSGDGEVPTFSFLGSTYTSRYLAFSPYEAEDRQEPPQPLQTVPNAVASLFARYDGSGSTPAAPFNPGQVGIPFLDLANRYVSSGDPAPFASLWQPGDPLSDGGPGRLAIADAIRDPTSTVGRYVHGALFIAEANYLSAAICSLDGEVPAAVCSSRAVKAGMRQIARTPALS